MNSSRPVRSPASWRAHYPFASQWMDLDGLRMHYVDERAAGPATPPTLGPNDGQHVLLFVHGNPTWSFHWRELIAAFRGLYRCVAPDHLGCGLSEVPNRPLRMVDRVDHLLRLVDHLQLDNITLVAQDWGGAIGLAAMLQRPERLRRIVLFNTGAFPPWYIPFRIRVCRMPGIGRLAVQGANLFCRAALRLALARRRRLPRDVAAGYLAGYPTWPRRRAVYDFVRDIPASPRHPTRDALQQLELLLPRIAELPILIIWGMADWCFRPDCLARFETLWPQAEVHRLDGVGHWVVEDASEEVVARLTPFLERRSAAPAALEDRDASLHV